MADEAQWESLKARLDEFHAWPDDYVFKFIMPVEQYRHVQPHLPSRGETTTRNSRHGAYISVTHVARVNSSDEVIAVYRAVAEIEGIISL